jgi:hypothetical protein
MATFDLFGQRATNAPATSPLIPSRGFALDRPVRERLESAFGVDFRDVRVHAGPPAERMARSMGAEAYTFGRDIVFGANRFRPDTPAGTALLAHELTHVAQQRDAVSDTRAPMLSRRGDASEREADAIASGERSARPVLRAARPLVHRAAIGSNAFGKWDLDETPTSAAKKGDPYNYKVTITFAPDAKKVNASEIAFVQTLSTLNEKKEWAASPGEPALKRLSKDNAAVDSVTKRGWVGYDDANKPYTVTPPGGTKAENIVEPGSSPKPLKNAVTRDWPGWNVPNLKWSFTSAAVARQGTDAGMVYGAVNWGFDVDASNKVTAHKASLVDVPDSVWKGAVEAWNKQAKGPEADRAAKDQEALPAFKFAEKKK